MSNFSRSSQVDELVVQFSQASLHAADEGVVTGLPVLIFEVRSCSVEGQPFEQRNEALLLYRAAKYVYVMIYLPSERLEENFWKFAMLSSIRGWNTTFVRTMHRYPSFLTEDLRIYRFLRGKSPESPLLARSHWILSGISHSNKCQ